MQDVFNNAQWAHKLKTESSMEQEKNVLPDLSSFYSRYGREGGTTPRTKQ